MSEAAFLVLLNTLVTLFPPFAQLLLRLLPDDDAEPLVGKVRSILPVTGASSIARQQLEAGDWRAKDDADELPNSR